MMLVGVALTQKNVAPIASPRRGLPLSNPLMRQRQGISTWFAVPMAMSNVMPEPLAAIIPTFAKDSAFDAFDAFDAPRSGAVDSVQLMSNSAAASAATREVIFV